jgi:hypothetical protein
MAAGLLARMGHLPPADRRLLAGAWICLAAMPLALALLPFRRLLDWAEGGAARRRVNEAPAPERAAALVAAAARYHLVPTTCLARALVLCRLLRRLGHPARLVLGGARGRRSFEAHAWVACGSLALTAGGPVDRFEPLLGAAVEPPARGKATSTHEDGV